MTSEKASGTADGLSNNLVLRSFVHYIPSSRFEDSGGTSPSGLEDIEKATNRARKAADMKMFPKRLCSHPHSHLARISMHTVAIQEDPLSRGSSGAEVWDAAEVLCHYISSFSKNNLEGRTVLELGAGGGLPGIYTAKLGAQVTLTDQEKMLDLIRYNCYLNGVEERCTVRELTWGQTDLFSIPVPDGGYDFILMSETVYSHRLYPALFDVVNAIAGNHTICLLAFETRTGLEHRFCDMMSTKGSFLVEKQEVYALPIPFALLNGFEMNLVRMTRRH